MESQFDLNGKLDDLTPTQLAQFPSSWSLLAHSASVPDARVIVPLIQWCRGGRKNRALHLLAGRQLQKLLTMATRTHSYPKYPPQVIPSASRVPL